MNQSLGNGSRGLLKTVLPLDARQPSIPGPHSGAHKRSRVMLCGTYKGGVGPSEVVKAVSEGGVNGAPLSRPLFFSERT